jgi:hypothetical protein
LNADQLYALRYKEIIRRLPEVSVKEIEDKSKGDAFVKGTALLQVLWLVVQVIARGIKHLPVSQIEIAVIAYVACTILTYLLSWSKPQNVTFANLASNQAILRDELIAVQNLGGSDHGNSFFQALTLKREVNIFKPIPNDADFDHLPGSTVLTFVDVGMAFAGTVFGAVHLITWNFHFPTPLSRCCGKYVLCTLLWFCPSPTLWLFSSRGWAGSKAFIRSPGRLQNL